MSYELDRARAIFDNDPGKEGARFQALDTLACALDHLAGGNEPATRPVMPSSMKVSEDDWKAVFGLLFDSVEKLEQKASS